MKKKTYFWETSKGITKTPAFEEKITMAVYMDTKGIVDQTRDGWVPTTKKKGPRRRLSKKKRRDRVKIKKL